MKEVATTASRVVKGRPTTKSVGARSAASPKAKLASPKPGAVVAPPSAIKTSAKPLATVAAPTDVKKPSRMAKLMASVQSVQGDSAEPSKKWPLWRKIALWVVMLMPLYAILIYLIGGLWFLPAELKGVGVNKSLPHHVTQVVNGIAIPDAEGVYVQVGADPRQPLNEVLQYNDRGLQPPVTEQFTTTSADLRYLLIRQAQVGPVESYQVFQIAKDNTDHLVPGVVAQRVPVARIALVALSLPAGKAWAPGSYVIVVPDLDDGTYYCFFTVTK